MVGRHWGGNMRNLGRDACILLGAIALSTAAVAAGVGAKYGARDPVTCASRSGPLNAQTAAKFFACDAEQEWSENLYLVTDVKVQVAPKGRPFNIRTDSFPQVDPSKPIYDIRGSFRHWQCSPRQSLEWDNHPGSACNYGDQPNAIGECYTDTFGDWHCKLLDVNHASSTVFHVPPPK